MEDWGRLDRRMGLARWIPEYWTAQLRRTAKQMCSRTSDRKKRIAGDNDGEERMRRRRRRSEK